MAHSLPDTPRAHDENRVAGPWHRALCLRKEERHERLAEEARSIRGERVLVGGPPQTRARRGFLWHRAHRYEERFANCSRTITPSRPAASQRGHGCPARP